MNADEHRCSVIFSATAAHYHEHGLPRASGAQEINLRKNIKAFPKSAYYLCSSAFICG